MKPFVLFLYESWNVSTDCQILNLRWARDIWFPSLLLWFSKLILNLNYMLKRINTLDFIHAGIVSDTWRRREFNAVCIPNLYFLRHSFSSLNLTLLKVEINHLFFELYINYLESSKQSAVMKTYHAHNREVQLPSFVYTVVHII